MEKIVVTPKNKLAFAFLKKLFSDLDSIDQIEIIEGDEIVDSALLKRILKNSKSGYVGESEIMKTLHKMRAH